MGKPFATCYRSGLGRLLRRLRRLVLELMECHSTFIFTGLESPH